MRLGVGHASELSGLAVAVEAQKERELVNLVLTRGRLVQALQRRSCHNRCVGGLQRWR